MTEPARLSGDEYMRLLQERADAWIASQGAVRSKFPPLLTWFIQEGDEHLVDPAILDKPAPQPKPVREPRRYRPASFWRERVARLTSERASLVEPLLPDRAAAGGVALGPRRTARIQQREDARLRQYVELGRRLAHAARMLRAAEQRETPAA
ncbi:hypothetical protein [Nocardia farcinica]|uniref:hypothetical protein n=1 Tax=Nocardia farcinica TaxID=37329 RepID=UPI00245769BB|nr:hypothetical protein [Nocardia farcinica]